jgi:hypothetical protein
MYIMPQNMQCSVAVIVRVLIVAFLTFFSLEKVLKSDDKFIDTKKALLKKREEAIVLEAKAAADKKVLYLFIIFVTLMMWAYSLL